LTKIFIVFSEYKYNSDDISYRCNEILDNSVSKIDRNKILKDILGIIDLTTLSGDDTDQRVNELCMKAHSFIDASLGIPNVAAVCVYPVFAGLVSKNLENTDINTACVAGAFPSGQSPLNIRIEEVKYAVENGADEIDMVISRGKLLEGDFNFVSNEVAEIKKACGNAHLKVILETGELGSIANIRKASEIAILAGADFIKTSTGKISPAATLESTLVMLDTIKEYFDKSGKMIGIKPAGGISVPDDAISYYLLVDSILGKSWLNKNYFRIGASRLTNNVYNELIK
jgi:deoxyribose-phosphate aldolase